MYGIFTYNYFRNQPNVGKYITHGSYGIDIYICNICISTSGHGFHCHGFHCHVSLPRGHSLWPRRLEERQVPDEKTVAQRIQSGQSKQCFGRRPTPLAKVQRGGKLKCETWIVFLLPLDFRRCASFKLCGFFFFRRGLWGLFFNV